VAVQAPSTATAGSTVTVSTVVTNTGDFPVGPVRMDLQVPAGWTATQEAPSSGFRFVPAHSSVTVTWRVEVPASAAPGPATLTATARYFTIRGDGTATGSANMLIT
jgi:uncharacterized membrane protein